MPFGLAALDPVCPHSGLPAEQQRHRHASGVWLWLRCDACPISAMLYPAACKCCRTQKDWVNGAHVLEEK